MRKKVKKYIANCLRIEFSLPSGKAEGFLHRIPKLSFTTIHIDHYGSLKKKLEKNTNIYLLLTRLLNLLKFKSTIKKKKGRIDKIFACV